MRPDYDLSGKKRTTEETPSFAKKILMALNKRAVSRTKPVHIYEGTANDKAVQRRRKKNKVARASRKRNR